MAAAKHGHRGPTLSSLTFVCRPLLRRRSASVDAGLREQLAAAQRIIRLAQLSQRHEVPGDASGTAPVEADEGAAPAQQEEQEQHAAKEQSCGAGEGRQATASSANAPSGSGASAGTDELGLLPGSGEQRLLDAFLRRTGGAALGRAALEQERLRLVAENAALQAVVGTVQAGSGVGPGAVDDPLNTLVIVNGRLQKALGGAAAARRALAGQAGGQPA